MTLLSDLRQVVYALSDALDLVGVDDVAHGKRVGVMAAECAKALGRDHAEVLQLFDLGLLHDIGVSSTVTHQHLVNEFDWAGSQQHAWVGCELLQGFSPLAHLALPVRYHHTRWDKLVTLQLEGKVAEHANLILLVDRVDAMAAPYYASGRVLAHSGEIRHEIERRSGTYFAPHLVQGFLAVSAHEAFWLSLESNALSNYLNDMARTGYPYQATPAELLTLARMFANIVDAKSRFTTQHSVGVAKVARALAERMGVDPENCWRLEVAGLLHDLGKLRIPDEILDKPGPLVGDERQIMNAHSFETMQILKKIQGFEDITAWAAHHHEAPGGKGYPFGLDGAQLPREARILRVADIFQAMVQDRPYRPGLAPLQVAEFMEGLQGQGSIDPEVAEVLLQHMDVFYALARGLPSDQSDLLAGGVVTTEVVPG